MRYRCVKIASETVKKQGTGTGGAIDVCAECGSEIIDDFKRGDYLCQNCGLVHGRVIDSEFDRRFFSTEEKAQRCRVGPFIFEKDKHYLLKSYISAISTDANDNKLSAEKKSVYNRLRRLDYINKSYSTFERNIFRAQEFMQGVASRLRLTQWTQNLAFIIYRRAVQMKMTKGRAISEVAAAAIYAACKSYHIVVSIKELSSASGVEKSTLWRVYSAVVKTLKVENVVKFSPLDFLCQVSATLKISPRIERVAAELLKEHSKKFISARNQMGLAAAAIYCAASAFGVRITQRVLSEASNVSEPTIRTNIKQFNKIILNKVKNEWHGASAI